MITRVVCLLVALVALYILWPALAEVFSSAPRLLTLNPVWFAVMLGLEIGSFVCIWALQRMAIRTDRWFGIATAQLGGNAVSRVVPGGAAAGGAVQFHMLTVIGIDGARVGTGLTAVSLISTGTLLALPVLSLPAMLAGRPVDSGLKQAALLGGVVFVIAFVAGWILVTRDGTLRRVGGWIQSVVNRVRRRQPPLRGLPETLLAERTEIVHTLGRRWWQALLLSLGNWLLDYFALLAALTAVGTKPRPSLVLLAYVGSMVLAMIPITPGGLGFVEAGLTAMLALAGVQAADAVLATLAYRLVSFWMPLPIGAVAVWLYRRRYRRSSRTATA